jgi:hypothetical protein
VLALEVHWPPGKRTVYGREEAFPMSGIRTRCVKHGEWVTEWRPYVAPS